MSSAAVYSNRLRPWLVLGRISNLPTVWSNCLAAWLLGGGGATGRFLLLTGGASCVYVGGMFLNDAFDVGFDRVHRRERPIPSGQVSLRTVWIAGLLALGLGLLALGSFGWTTFLLGLLLVLAVVVYDATHKYIAFSPGVMALCRFLLFLAAGSAAASGVTGATAWSAVALSGYIVGLSYVARTESTGGLTRWWPLLLLGLPVVLAGFMNPPNGWFHSAVAAPVAIFLIWTLRSLSYLFRTVADGPRRTVSGLLAGIVLVDLVAVMAPPFPLGVVFLALFVAALLMQRIAPAT